MTGGHRRILVVEDDPETAGQLKEQLTASGYQVDLAGTGSEALSQGGAHDYGVITIDRMLPDIDGIAVMRQLRHDGVAAPFLIISALGEVDDKVRGLPAGGDDLSGQAFLLPRAVGATGSAWPAQRHHRQGDDPARRTLRLVSPNRFCGYCTATTLGCLVSDQLCHGAGNDRRWNCRQS